MSVVRVKYEFRTLFDFGNNALSKNKIRKVLRETKIQTKDVNLENVPIFIRNEISIGMYLIKLELPLKQADQRNFCPLKAFGKFNVDIYQQNVHGSNKIDISKHCIFKKKDWAGRLDSYQVGVADLADIILLCSRLERIKAFN